MAIISTELPSNAVVRPDPLKDPGLQQQVANALQGMESYTRYHVEQDAALRAIAGNELSIFRDSQFHAVGAAEAPRGFLGQLAGLLGGDNQAAAATTQARMNSATARTTGGRTTGGR